MAHLESVKSHTMNSLEACILKSVDVEYRQLPKFICAIKKLQQKTLSMQNAFSGDIAYAVKANPRVEILQTLMANGITHFDVASINEIKLVHGLMPKAKLLFNNPIKTPAEIQTAAREYGVKHFTVQDCDEIKKILTYTEPLNKQDLEIAVRLKAPKSSVATINHSRKFGVDVSEAESLCLYLESENLTNITLSVHIGSANHTTSIAPYKDSLEKMYALARKFSSIKGFNLGGGFPANFYHTEEKHDVLNMLRKISVLFNSAPREERSYQYYIEPGLSLVADTTVLVTPVVQVDKNEFAIRIRDGIYTSYFCYHIHGYNTLPAYLYRPCNGKLIKITAEPILFKVYGQTCDGGDELSMLLPRNIQQHDIICLETAGAYMGSVASRFNGFDDVEWIFIDE
ncbi:MAG: hypothetical protein K0U12_02080 [Gammaproteobacteria bacterium]|nr:hypothetical protein [Gammaproteobacteria bacterium]